MERVTHSSLTIEELLPNDEVRKCQRLGAFHVRGRRIHRLETADRMQPIETEPIYVA